MAVGKPVELQLRFKEKKRFSNARKKRSEDESKLQVEERGAQREDELMVSRSIV